MRIVPPAERRVPISWAFRSVNPFVFCAQSWRRSLVDGAERKAQIMNILHVDSGILGSASVTRRLSAAAVAQWRAQHPEANIVYRDLVSDPIDHLTGDFL